jgi:hypothetical protein
MMLKAQAMAAEHIRDCERCGHIFEVALFEMSKHRSSDPPDAMILGTAPDAFHVTANIRLELRKCPDWPRLF